MLGGGSLVGRTLVRHTGVLGSSPSRRIPLAVGAGPPAEAHQTSSPTHGMPIQPILVENQEKNVCLFFDPP